MINVSVACFLVKVYKVRQLTSPQNLLRHAMNIFPHLFERAGKGRPLN